MEAKRRDSYGMHAQDWNPDSPQLLASDDADAQCLLAKDGSVLELNVHEHVPYWQRQSLRSSLWQRMANALRQRRIRNSGSAKSTVYLEADGDDASYGPGRVASSSSSRRRTWRGALLWFMLLVLALYGLVQISLLTLGAYVLNRPPDPSLKLFAKPSADANGVLRYPTDFTKDITPVPVHSHNDYWRRVPLFEAISYGCTGVEADVWLFNNELLVGHDTPSLTTQRTFRSLYVDPIVEILDRQNTDLNDATSTRRGVFDEDPSQPLMLLVDLKTNGRETFPFVVDQLDGLRSKGYLTHFDGSKFVSGAVTVVMTGNTPFDMLIANTTYRDVFFDAPLVKIWEDASPDPSSEGASFDGSGQGLEGLEGIESAAAFTPENSYYASVSFSKTLGWPQLTRLSDGQIQKIKSQIEAVHKQGLKVRYWDTPTWPVWVRNHVWEVLTELGADMLNADDLEAAATKDWTRPSGWFW